MARLSLTLLGGLQGRLDPGGALVLPTRKAQALLAYLALPLGQAHPRDKLAALLWGDIRDESARASLRQALFAVRKALADTGALRQDGDTLALDATAVSVDVAAFEQAIKDGTAEALERAAALYRGDLMAGLVVDEAPFEEWLLGERERLRELALEALAKLLAHQRRGGAAEAAVVTALKLLTLDPLQEPVHRSLMRLYVDLRRRGAALRQYQSCISALQRELGTEPEPETQQLYQEILRTPQVRPAAVESKPAVSALDRSPERPTPIAVLPGARKSSAFIGRATEAMQLAGELDRVIAGEGRVVAAIGEAGVGKTRLLTEFAAGTAARGVSVLTGRAYESERILPFGAWVDALSGAAIASDAALLERLGPARCAELSRLLPDIPVPPPGGAVDPRRLFEAIATLVEQLAATRPLLVVLEDLHWADEMTARLLAFVGRRIARTRALIAVSARAEETDESSALAGALEELTADGRLTTLPLPPLSRAETGALVHALARSGSGAKELDRLADRIWAVSEGNPFVVVETLQAAGEGSALGDGLPLPERVRSIVTRRVDRLSERARALAAVASTVGREFEFGLVAHAAGFAPEDAAAGLEELVRRRVLHGVGERFDFTHDRIRTAVYGALLPPRRMLWHRRVAAALEAVYATALDTEAPAIAWHASKGELWEKAVDYLRRSAALAVSRAAYRQAAAFLEQALEAYARLPTSAERIEEAIDLHLELRHTLWPLDANDRILEHLRAAEALAERIDDRLRLARVATYRLQLLRQTGGTEAAVTAGRYALRLAEESGDRALQVVTKFFFGQTLLARGDYDDADDILRSNREALRGELARQRFGVPGYPAAFTLQALALCAAERGEFAEAIALGAEAVALADSIGQPFTMVATYPGVANVFLLRGDAASSVGLLERTRALCPPGEFDFHARSASASLGYAYHLMGRTAESGAPLEAATGDVSGATVTFQAGWLTWLGQVYLGLGRVEDARTMGERAVEFAERHVHLGRLGWAHWLLAEVSVAERAPADAVESHLARAVAIADPRRMRPLLAHCHLTRATLLATVGRRESARDEMQTALAAYRTMAMPYWIERAEAQLATLS